MDISGSRSMNLPLDQELIVQASKTFGDKKCNATTGAFVAGNMHGDPGTVGVYVELMGEGNSLSVQLSNTVKFFRQISGGFGTEVFNNGTHIMTCDGKYSFIKLLNGRKLSRESFGLGYKHVKGHNGHLAISQVGDHNLFTFDVSAKAKVWSSADNATTVELTGNITYYLSGPFAGSKKFGGGLGFTHRF
ncbi:attacin-A [Zeugodacus cucurbitae]|uniref:Attacin-A n=1 Tax=Zeugodacus cucurbitae TaxID=28588 RepID=A0A0A1WER4_ZEUCU|nr:attacin-A [Zeugodacus cucurbitae]